MPLVASVFSFFLVFFGSEYFLRWLFRRGKFRVWPSSGRLEFSVDQKVLPELECRAQVFFNREGERGDEPPLFGPFYRILVAGGSCAECWYLDNKSTWPMQLQLLLSQPGSLKTLGSTRVHVGNVGRSLVDSARLFSVLKIIISQHRSVDCVIIMTGLSDIVRWMATGTLTPLLSDSSENYKGLFEIDPNHQFQLWPMKSSALVEASRRLTRPFQPIHKRSGAGKSIARLRKMRHEANEILDEAPDATDLMRIFSDNLHRSVSFCQKAGSRVLIVGQPMVQTKDLDDTQLVRLWNGGRGNVQESKVTSYYSSECMARLLKEIGIASKATAEETGAMYVDLQQHFEDTAPIFYDDSHFTPEGARIVASVIAQELLKCVKANVA